MGEVRDGTSGAQRIAVSVWVAAGIGWSALTPLLAQTDPADCARIFAGRRVITRTVTSPRSVVAADLDGDGDTDVVSASWGNIAWYENTDGLGTFGPRKIITTMTSSNRTVFAADLDGDGDTDVLSASRFDHRIAWYENTDGLGSFGPQQIITTTSYHTQTVFAADLDGDGDTDVISTSRGSKLAPDILWYENTNGLGAFGAQQVITNDDAGVVSVFGADLDGDGDTDVLSGSENHSKIAWYENTNGLGAFGPQQVIASAAFGAVWGVHAADLDGDGDIDALSASGANKIAWYENTDGLGVFGAQKIITSAADGATAVFAADLDGDGDFDVLSASHRDNKIAWYENTDGLGAFGPQQVMDAAADGTRSVVAADIDGDGDADVLSASIDNGTIAWYENEADCNENGVNDGCDVDGGTSADCDGNNGPDECDVADTDCNGNGVPDECDIADGPSTDCNGNGVPDECDTADGQIGDCNGNGIPDDCDVADGTSRDCNANGVLDECDLASGAKVDCNANGVPDECDVITEFATHTITTVVGGTGSVFTADIDGDGDADILSASVGNDTIAWYENVDGLGSFGIQQVITREASDARSVFAADLDGDGDTDVLSASAVDDKIAWYENTDGLGNFGQQQVITSLADFAESVRAADLDHDGDMDVLSASSGDHTIAWYENTDGLGAFGPRLVITSTAFGALSVHTADVNGDGYTDVLSASFFDNKIAWYENTNGLGAFSPPRTITIAGEFARFVFAADLDGDGDTDVLSASDSEREVAWYENTDGLGSFGAPQIIHRSRGLWGAESVFAADLDGDGDIDVLSSHFRQDRIAWYENLDGKGSFGQQRIITNDALGAWFVIAADLNGDGDIEVLSATVGDHEIEWYENLGVSRDCNTNGVIDECDLAEGFSADCNGNDIPDNCDLANGFAVDCDGNGVPDDCQIGSGTSQDCNGNDVPDECDIADGLSLDCNRNERPDRCDVADGTSADCNSNDLPDECEPDCNINHVPDDCDLADGTSADEDQDGVPDECGGPGAIPTVSEWGLMLLALLLLVAAKIHFGYDPGQATR